MYAGEVNVSQEQLPAFLKTAARLKVKYIFILISDTRGVPPAGFDIIIVTSMLRSGSLSKVAEKGKPRENHWNVSKGISKQINM